MTSPPIGGWSDETRVSPDGAIGVEFEAAEWANSQWVYAPRVIEAATGRIVLDLWQSDWDAGVSFPGAGRVALGLRRFVNRAALVAELDLARGRYRITGEDGAPFGEGPLKEIAGALDKASRYVAPAGAPAPPRRRMAVGPALVLFAAAAVAIVLMTIVMLRLTPTPPREPIVLRTVPPPPPPPGSR